MPNYRVFVSRHFIDVCWFDIESPTKARARNAARKAANNLRNREQSRANAADNTWIPDDGIEIKSIGYPHPDSYQMKLFYESPDKIVKVYSE